MSVEDQFRDLTRELASRKESIRNFSETKHDPTDGEWKEKVLREVLSRHLPKVFEPIRGFVTNGEESTRQIDILVYDSRKPMRFREGDVAFVTPDAVAGIIEVKSTIASISKLGIALQSLASNIEKIRKQGNPSAFAGLFAFDTKLAGHKNLKPILECLRRVTTGMPERVVNLVTLGDAIFVLHWEGPEPHESGTRRRRWYAYNLPEMAPGYFVSNVVHSLVPDSVGRYVDAWFPKAPPRGPGLADEDDLGFGVAVYESTKHGSY